MKYHGAALNLKWKDEFCCKTLLKNRSAVTLVIMGVFCCYDFCITMITGVSNERNEERDGSKCFI